MENIVLSVKGMTCGGCVNSVKRVVESVAGVSQADVVLETGKVSIAYDPALAMPEHFKAAIQDAGYQVV